jgi:hypothetical protein
MGDIHATIDDIQSKTDAFRIVDDLPDWAKSPRRELNDNFGKTKAFYQKEKNKMKSFNKDIFSTLTGIWGAFTTFKNEELTKERLWKITKEASKNTIKTSKSLLLQNVEKYLFAGDGICGANTIITGDTITVTPAEFDLYHLLTVDPTSNSGQIVYESANPDRGYVKMNRVLYNAFTSPQSITNKNGDKLFNVSWDEGNQQYIISGLSLTSQLVSGRTTNQFIGQYYSSIEDINITGITKMAMLLTINGDTTEPQLFDYGLNDLNRLLNKLFKVCGSPNSQTGLEQNPGNQFNEDDEDIEFYFDFDDVDGIDLDEESRRLRKVLKFADCGDFEIPVNANHFEDFVFLSNKKDIDDAVKSTLSNIAMTTFQESSGTIPMYKFNINLLNNLIINYPKAILGTILSPKYFVPVMIIYKLFKQSGESLKTLAKNLMKNLYKLFYHIIHDIFWTFIKEFWKIIKKDLLDFLKNVAYKIAKDKLEKYKYEIGGLIALITVLLASNIDNCSSLFDIINKTFDISLLGGPNIRIPGFLLSFASGLPGYSHYRATGNFFKWFKKVGGSLEDFFGQEINKMKHFAAGIFRHHQEEQAKNGYVETGNELTVIPVAGLSAPIVLPPGAIKSNGKSR